MSGASKGKERATDGDLLALDIGAAEEGLSGANGQANGGFMQMQMMEQQVGLNISWFCPTSS